MRFHRTSIAFSVFAIVTAHAAGKTLKVPADYPTIGTAITLAAPGARLERLVIRHATHSEGASDGHGVSVEASAVGAELHDLTILRSATNGVMIMAPDVTLTSSVILGCEFGVRVWSDGVRTQGCEISRASKGGLNSIAEATVVRKCRVRAVGLGTGIMLQGPGSSAEGNRISNAGKGITLWGLDSTARKNVIADCRSVGLLLLAPDTRAEQNTISGCSDRDVWIGAQAANTVLIGNQVTRSGLGIHVEGSDAVLHDNLSKGNADDGFRVVGDRAMLTSNRALQNLVDGFDLEAGVDHELTANVARKNHGEGIDVDAPGVSLRQNDSRKNRLDVGIASPPAVFDQNVFVTGGLTTPPVVD